MTTSRPTTFPRIVRNPEILSGEPTIRGTRISVRIIVLNYRCYRSIVPLLEAFPHLTADDIREALAYYEANRHEIERYIAENDRVYDE